MAGILGFGVGDGNAEGDFSDGDGENADDGEGRVMNEKYYFLTKVHQVINFRILRITSYFRNMLFRTPKYRKSHRLPDSFLLWVFENSTVFCL